MLQMDKLYFDDTRWNFEVCWCLTLASAANQSSSEEIRKTPTGKFLLFSQSDMNEAPYPDGPQLQRLKPQITHLRQPWRCAQKSLWSQQLAMNYEGLSPKFPEN